MSTKTSRTSLATLTSDKVTSVTGAKEESTMRSTRNSRPFWVATLLLTLAGCGGGSGGGADEPGTPAASAGGGTLL
jgi:hypothetical protein